MWGLTALNFRELHAYFLTITLEQERWNEVFLSPLLGYFFPQVSFQQATFVQSLSQVTTSNQ